MIVPRRRDLFQVRHVDRRAEVRRDGLSGIQWKVKTRVEAAHGNQKPWRRGSRHVRRESVHLSRPPQIVVRGLRAVNRRRGMTRADEPGARHRRHVRRCLRRRAGGVREPPCVASLTLSPGRMLTASVLGRSRGVSHLGGAGRRRGARIRPRSRWRDRRARGWRQRDAHRGRHAAPGEERFRASVGAEQWRSLRRWPWLVRQRRAPRSGIAGTRPGDMSLIRMGTRRWRWSWEGRGRLTRWVVRRETRYGYVEGQGRWKLKGERCGCRLIQRGRGARQSEQFLAECCCTAGRQWHDWRDGNGRRAER